MLKSPPKIPYICHLFYYLPMCSWNSNTLYIKWIRSESHSKTLWDCGKIFLIVYLYQLLALCWRLVVSDPEDMCAETVGWWRHVRLCSSNESRHQTPGFFLLALLQLMQFSLKVFWHTLLLPPGDVFAPYPLPLPVLYRCGIVSCRFVCTKTNDPAALALRYPCLVLVVVAC